MKKIIKLSDDVGYFRFKRLGNKILLVNDLGDHVFLPPADFDRFLAKGNKSGLKNLPELKKKDFLKTGIDTKKFIERFACKNEFLECGPCLHIVILTLRCNHRCIYCQASSESLHNRDLDMDKKTAAAAVEMIFSSPSKNIMIEFQGGEPLANFDVLKFIIQLAQNESRRSQKKMAASLVSNLSLMDDKKLDFLVKNKVSICTSLDGPEFLHNKNRIFNGGNSYQLTVDWIKKIEAKLSKRGDKVDAITTVTTHSLLYGKEIVDEYVKLGLPTLGLQFIQPFGLARKTLEMINYSPREFVSFYRQTLDYVIDLNWRGVDLMERYALHILPKILTDRSVNFFEMRSPCGAGIGQLAYNFNGDVYTCDEGRMLSRMGEESFRLGNISKNSYKEIIDNPTVKINCLASTLDGLPGCADCVYKPFCGVCPIFNFVHYGNIFSQAPNNDRCQIYRGMFDYIFEKLQEPKAMKVFKKWMRAAK